MILFDDLPNFPPPQVKRSATISNKHGIFELPHEMPSDLRLSGNIRRISKLQIIIA